MAVLRDVRKHALPALAVFMVLACSDLPGPSDFRVGATREEILDSFGAPARKQTIVKRDDAIWGAIEDFWTRVPLNSTVEIWTYRVEGGSIELYFVDESDKVQGKEFAPDGVDY